MSSKRFSSMYGSWLIAAAVSLLFIAGCKKDDNDDNSGNTACRIYKIAQIGQQDVLIGYDLNGRISTVNNNDYLKSYDYNDNTITITKSSAGALLQRTFINNNSDGLATSVRNEFGANGATWNTYNFEYSGTNVTAAYYNDNDNNKDTTWFEWKNGNTTRILTRADTLLTTYHTDQKLRAGDYLKTFQTYDLGYEYLRTAHLIKSISGPSKITNYSYVYDPNNVITGVTIVDPQTTSINYSYECP